jgi:ABC-type sugar transport system permease subunit
MGIPVGTSKKVRLPQIMAWLVPILLLGINLVFFILVRNTPGIITENKSIHDNPLLFIKVDGGDGDGQILVATKNNTVIIFNQDMEELVSRGFDETILDMKRNPVTGTLHIATSLGNFYTLDPNLEQLSLVNFPGRLVSFDLAGEDGFYLISGGGNNSPEWYLLKLDLHGQEIYRHHIGIYTTKVTKTEEGVAFGTFDGFVIYLDDHGNQLWRSMASGTISDLTYARRAKTLFAVDTKGTVTAFDGNGNTRWSTVTSQYRLNTLAINDRGIILAADNDGGLFMLDASGKQLLSQQLGADIVTDMNITSKGYFYVSCSTGKFFTVNTDAIYNRIRIELMGRILWLANPLLVIGFVVFLILSFRKSTEGIRKILYKIGRSTVSYLFILPAFVLTVFFCFYPIITAFVYSFLHYTLAAPPRFVGFNNFISIFRDETMWIGAGNMILITVVDVIKHLTVPLLVAELIFWLRRERNRRIIRTLFVIPSVVPGVVASLLWKNIYNSEYGLINNFLRLVGLGQYAHAWMAERGTAIWSIIFVGFPWVGAFQFLVLMGGLLNIPGELYEAAKIDGTNIWQRFWKIDLPMLRPQIGLLLFFSYIGSIQGYQNILLLTQGGPGYATYVPAFYMYRKLSLESNFGYASAIGVTLFFVVLAGTIINRILLRSKEGVE